jgi:hypothetical protein
MRYLQAGEPMTASTEIAANLHIIAFQNAKRTVDVLYPHDAGYRTTLFRGMEILQNQIKAVFEGVQL